jgi:RNA polymerase sigma-70 factor, ECF subfamily
MKMLARCFGLEDTAQRILSFSNRSQKLDRETQIPFLLAIVIERESGADTMPCSGSLGLLWDGGVRSKTAPDVDARDDRDASKAVLLSSDAMTSSSFLAQLLVRIAGRDPEAFAALYPVTVAKLYGITLRILKRRDVADDVLQDVYVRIWEKAVEFDVSKGSPMGWMGAIARNRALDELRRNRSPLIDTDDSSEAEDVISDAKEPLVVLEHAEELARLSQCLERLDAERREMVLLAYREGVSREELSERLGRPVGTIKTWLRRSLIELKACLDR